MMLPKPPVGTVWLKVPPILKTSVGINFIASYSFPNMELPKRIIPVIIDTQIDLPFGMEFVKMSERILAPRKYVLGPSQHLIQSLSKAKIVLPSGVWLSPGVMTSEPLPGLDLPPGVFLVDVVHEKANLEHVNSEDDHAVKSFKDMFSDRPTNLEADRDDFQDKIDTRGQTVFPPPGFVELLSSDQVRT